MVSIKKKSANQTSIYVQMLRELVDVQIQKKENRSELPTKAEAKAETSKNLGLDRP